MPRHDLREMPDELIQQKLYEKDVKRIIEETEYIEEYIREWMNGDSGTDFRLIQSLYKTLCEIVDKEPENLGEMADF